jgi:outer membrane immunogenic protein
MKKFLLGTVALIAFAAPAAAADLAARPYTKAPPAPVAVVYDWSGFYIGANGGWGSAGKCWDLTADVVGPFVPPLAEGCHDATGGTAGGQIGYRWQAGTWVFGLEGQGNWADFKGSNTSLAFFTPLSTIENESKINAFGLITGQVGYAWNNVLLYVKGGAAVTSDKYRGIETATGLLVDSAKETRWGGVVGAGLEIGFAPNWSVGFEYNHLFLGDRDVDFAASGNFIGAPAGSFSRTGRISQDVDIVTARVNYRFGGPVIARY